MIRSWGAATVVMALFMAIYLASVKLSASQYIAGAAYWAGPILGALTAAYLAPRHKFNVGAGTIALAAVVLGVGNYVFGELGNLTDLPGVQGSFIVAAFSIPMVAIPCVLGALAGEWLSKGHADA
jgi:hypothetical protein